MSTRRNALRGAERTLLSAFLAAAGLAGGGAPAAALDPECDPSAPEHIAPYDPASGPYPADQNLVRFCTPLTDARGETLTQEAIERCYLEVTDPTSGSTTTYARATDLAPGELVRIAVDAQTVGERDLRVFCTGRAGAGEAQTADATFSGGTPAAPAAEGLSKAALDIPEPPRVSSPAGMSRWSEEDRRGAE